MRHIISLALLAVGLFAVYGVLEQDEAANALRLMGDVLWGFLNRVG